MHRVQLRHWPSHGEDDTGLDPSLDPGLEKTPILRPPLVVWGETTLQTTVVRERERVRALAIRGIRGRGLAVVVLMILRRVLVLVMLVVLLRVVLVALQ